MNARLYYRIRIVVLLAILLGMPLLMIVRGDKPDREGFIFLAIFDAILVAGLAIAVVRYRNAAPDAKMRGYGPPPEVVRAAAERGSRRMPLMAFGLGVIALAGSYYFLAYQHRGHPVLFIFMPALTLLGLAGTIHPPIFYAMRNDIGEQPGGARAIAYFLTAIGLAIGGFLAWLFFWR